MRKLFTRALAAASLFALFSGSALAQNAITVIGTISADIRQPLSGNQDVGLNFSDLLLVDGTATIDTAGNIAYSDPNMEGFGATPAAGSFTINGEANFTYAVTLPASVIIQTGGNSDQVVDTFTVLTDTTGATDGTGTLDANTPVASDTVRVGATLNLDTSTATSGVYAGNYPIGIAYN